MKRFVIYLAIVTAIDLACCLLVMGVVTALLWTMGVTAAQVEQHLPLYFCSGVLLLSYLCPRIEKRVRQYWRSPESPQPANSAGDGNV